MDTLHVTCILFMYVEPLLGNWTKISVSVQNFRLNSLVLGAYFRSYKRLFSVRWQRFSGKYCKLLELNNWVS